MKSKKRLWEPAEPERLGYNIALNHSTSAGSGQAHRRKTQEPTSDLSTAIKADCGISTAPTTIIFFLPAFCFSSSLRLRVMSPP